MRILVLAGLVAVLAGCGPTSNGSASTHRPQPSPKGVLLQQSAALLVGAEGGTLTSPDGRLLVTVPAGALATPAELSVNEITNTAPGGIGNSYRLGPEGTLFQSPVQLQFTMGAGSDLNLLAVAYQEQQGFWLRQRVVTRNQPAGTLTVAADRLGDWTVVTNVSARDLRGAFTIQNTIGVPFTATGNASLDFALDDPATADRPAISYYVSWGTISASAPIQSGSASCTPDVATQDLGARIASVVPVQPSFEWGVAGAWDLQCTPASGPVFADFAALVFDTAGVSHIRCARSYSATPTIGLDHVAGTYLIDCGADGTLTGTFDFVTCTPGVACQPPDPCQTGTSSCDTGASTCVATGAAVDGTSCGTYQACSGGVCTCTAGASCPPQDVCHVGTVSCGASGPACDQTPVPDGTACGVSQVCLSGTCT